MTFRRKYRGCRDMAATAIRGDAHNWYLPGSVQLAAFYAALGFDKYELIDRLKVVLKLLRFRRGLAA